MKGGQRIAAQRKRKEIAQKNVRKIKRLSITKMPRVDRERYLIFKKKKKIHGCFKTWLAELQ